MSNKDRNRKSRKGNTDENRTAAGDPRHQKLEDNPRNLTDNVSTAGASADAKYSRTNLKKDEKEERS